MFFNVISIILINILLISALNLNSEFRLKVENVAIQAARAAGEIILNGGKIDKNIESKIGDRDIVTNSDKACQEILQKTISNVFPKHSILGEEDVPPGRDAAIQTIEKLLESNPEHIWIIDPIDGTTNYACDMKLCGVIISYVNNKEVQFGCIYDPYHDEMFTAWKNHGAYLTTKDNKTKISVCDSSSLAKSVVCTGSPPNLDSLDACLRAQLEISKDVRTVRILGSAAINLAWVACGRMAAYFEADMNVWDVAAGSLLIQEGGGTVSDVDGNKYTLLTRNFVGTNGLIHKELTQRLRKANHRMP